MFAAYRQGVDRLALAWDYCDADATSDYTCALNVYAAGPRGRRLRRAGEAAREFRELEQRARCGRWCGTSIADRMPEQSQRGRAAVDLTGDRLERWTGRGRVRLQHVSLHGEEHVAEVVHEARREEGEVGGGWRHATIVPSRWRRRNA